MTPEELHPAVDAELGAVLDPGGELEEGSQS
jgi:hypothetical protein